MCALCADIDYRVASCWRPCYVPTRRHEPRQRQDLGEEQYKGLEIVWALRKQLRDSEQRNRLLVAELEILKARRAPKSLPSPTDFIPVQVAVND